MLYNGRDNITIIMLLVFCSKFSLFLFDFEYRYRTKYSYAFIALSESQLMSFSAIMKIFVYLNQFSF